ncbi:LamG-like jellyroll fold domain-containing protein [Acinetobacter kookii]
MAGIRLEFAQFGHFDSFDIIRSMTSMVGVADVDLPAPIATGVKTMYYVDNMVTKGVIYYYKVRVWRDTTSFLSSEVIVQSGDAFIDSVELLIFADAATFPSSIFTDSSPKARAVNGNGGIQIVNTQQKFLDDGWIHFNNTSYYDSSNKFLTAVLQSALFTEDFTFESFVKPDYAKATVYGRFFAIGTHSTNGMISLSKSGNPWVLNIDTFINGSWQGSVAAASPPTLPDGQINHICLMRKSGIFYAFAGGVVAATKSDATNFSLSQTNVFVGTHPFNNGAAFESFGGFMSSIRLSRYARYNVSGFTPPTIKFSSI